jgi:DNA invertase Pin-like site-specific DNA recombinase
MASAVYPRAVRVALYARVSTLNHTQDSELQIHDLREYVSRRGWEIAAEYVDRGFSGSKDSRPALNRLMADAGSRKFDAVLVWKLDRFGRSLRRQSGTASIRHRISTRGRLVQVSDRSSMFTLEDSHLRSLRRW